MKLFACLAFTLVICNVFCEELTDEERDAANAALHGTGHFQGDIKLSRQQKAGMKNRVSIGDLSQRWERGVIPYVIDRSLSSQAGLIRNAMNHIQQQTRGCIRFVNRTREANYLNILNGQGCYSFMGNIFNGAQEVSLGQGCHYFGTAVHELMHAIGFDHEQCRPDRDNFLEIHKDNIIIGQEDQFSLTPGGVVYFDDFDYDSIMLYGNKAFTANGEDTMTAFTGQRLSEPYDKNTMSPNDAEQIRKFYSGVCA